MSSIAIRSSGSRARAAFRRKYLVAIMGVETKYGRVTGHYRVLDALMTLSFDYPPRSDYFRWRARAIPAALLRRAPRPSQGYRLVRRRHGCAAVHALQLRLFAVDGNADQQRDLWNDWDDILASIANYFVEHGWEAGGPVLAETKLDPEPKFQIDTRQSRIERDSGQLNAQGVEILGDQTGTTPVVLVSAEQQDGPAYRVGFKNFYVITRYNRSARYAMAVHDLAAAIVQRVNSGSNPGGCAALRPKPANRTAVAIRPGPGLCLQRGSCGSLHLRMGARRLLDCRQEAHTRADNPRSCHPRRRNVESIPDAIPRREPRSAHGNPPFYKVLGRRYVVLATADGYLERGRRFLVRTHVPRRKHFQR